MKTDRIFIPLQIFFFTVLFNILMICSAQALETTEILGRPTDHSVTINVVSDQDVDIFFEYGKYVGIYTGQTEPFTAATDFPAEITIEGLEANTRYYYRMHYRLAEAEPWENKEEQSFHTQRPPGSSFAFVIQSDAHLRDALREIDGDDQASPEIELYTRTLLNEANDNADFMIDLGDTFFGELANGYPQAKKFHSEHRPFFNLVANTTPLFLALGNHEGESAWHLDDTTQNVAVWSARARKLYYPNPSPDDFYSGNTTDEEFTGLRENYYSWQWGDALFVVLDPYGNTLTNPQESGDGWDWTLGDTQYHWLKQTLEESTAEFKFVFSHQMTAGIDLYGIGGVEGATYYEWGGNNLDDSWGFDINRPEWEKPIHQLMVDTGVSIFFHGHDHGFAKQELDGVIYQLCPKPSDASYTSVANRRGYLNGDLIPNSGHLRVSVSAAEAAVEYVRAYLPGDGVNGEVAYAYTLEAIGSECPEGATCTGDTGNAIEPDEPIPPVDTDEAESPDHDETLPDLTPPPNNGDQESNEDDTDNANEISPETEQSPAEPALSYVTDGYHLTVTWPEVPGASSYTLYYAPYPYAGPETIGSLPLEQENSFSIDLWENAAYYVAVTASNNLGESAYSNIELFIMPPARPPAPVLSYDGQELALTLQWTEVPEAIGYKLYYAEKTDPQNFYSLDMGNAHEASYTLWEGAAFYFNIASYTSAGVESEVSNTGYFEIIVPNSDFSDDDSDGFTEVDGDCDDNDASMSPAKTDVCGDGVDQDCSGSDQLCPIDSNDVDNDNDGFTENNGDCNDLETSIHPGSTEICADGIDQDCSGSDELCQIDPKDVDDDNDGFTENGGDCNDSEISIFPGSAEVCGDGIDQDCNDSDELCPAVEPEVRPYTIVDTGVTTFYSNSNMVAEMSEGEVFYGQDANYYNNNPLYTDNSNGTTTDNNTGLMWQQDMHQKMTIAEAEQYVETLVLGGHSDWRIPTIKELYSLIQFTGQVAGEGAITPFIDTNYFSQPFGDTSIGEREIDAQTWSATEYVGTTMNSDRTVFGVNFVDGRIKGYPTFNRSLRESNSMYFRMVRGNPLYGENQFVDNLDGTISDLATGLMWQKTDDGVARNWQDSLTYCESLELAGHSDWRLPNAKELQSIVDYTRSPQTTASPAIDPLFETTEILDPNETPGQYPYFWTGTTHLDGINPYSSAVYIAFGEGQGEMNGTLMDVHGAGCQRSDPKSGDSDDFPDFHGPQGDVRYVYNHVRAVRSISSSQ